MSDPKRLVDGGDLHAILLQSARAIDGDQARARKAALLTASIAGGATIAGALTGKGLWQSALVKWLFFGVIAAAAGGVGLSRAGWFGPSPVAEARSVAAVTRERAAVAGRSIAQTASADSPKTPGKSAISINDLPDAEPRRDTPSPKASAAVEPVEDTLAEEVASLAEARRALAEGKGRAALAALAAHQTKFPKGRLGVEAEVLRIEALAASGDKRAAAEAAERFEALHPKSPYAARVRAVTGR